MTDRHLEDDLALHAIPADDGRSARDERLEDALRPSEVAAAWRAASEAPEGAGGERARRRLRLVARPYLDRAGAEPRAELEARRSAGSPPERGFEYELLTIAAPGERRRVHQRWLDAEARLAEARIQLALAEASAARAAGAASPADFLAAAHPTSCERTCATYEAGAIAPLDDAVERASRDRRLRSPWSLLEPEHPADSPLAGALAGYAQRFPAAEIAPVLRSLGGALGCDPDHDGPAVIHDTGSCVHPRPWITRGRGQVRIGALDGPGALAEALSAFGRLARRGFVVALRRAAGAAASDPAFDVAAGLLFARLVLSPAFRARFGPRPDAGLDADLKLEAALAPRLAWTYLYIALQRRGDEGCLPEGEARRALRRALGRPPAVDQELAPLGCDPRGAAQLRGTVLALLLEERLLSRWGRDWFAEGRAGGFLRECWEAETGQTAESVANGLDLGTIEPTPILDGCRP